MQNRRLLLALVRGFLILTGPLRAQTDTPRPRGPWAETACRDGVPFTTFRSDVTVGSIEAQILDAHEAVHRRQLTGDSIPCEAKLLRITSDPHRLLAAEADAYCAQALFSANVAGTDFYRTLALAARALWYFFDGRVTPGEIAEALMRVCPISNQSEVW